MTEMLDPYELTAPDQVEVPPRIPEGGLSELPVLDLGEFELGAACNLGDTDCEACQ